MIAAGGDTDGSSGERAGGGFQCKMRRLSGEMGYLHPLQDRRVEGVAKALDEIDDFRFHHESMGLFTGIAVAGELALPVGGDKAETIPALVLPRMEGNAALQHQMADIVLGHVP